MGLILILFFLGMAAVVLQYWFIRKRLGRTRALAISLLRFFAIFSLISFALNPSRVEKKEYKVPTSLAVLIDVSQSMNHAGSGEKVSRIDEAKALLLQEPGSLLNALTQGYDVRLYSLGESLRSIEAKDLSGLKAEGKRGDMNEALERLRGKDAFAILLSDGNLKWEDGVAKDLPVLVFPAGNPKDYRDVLIKSVKAPAIASGGGRSRSILRSRVTATQGSPFPLF